MPAFFTKRLVLFVSLIFCVQLLFAADKADSLKQKLILPLNSIDSLKKQLRVSVEDSLKGRLYMQIAGQYMKYDTIRNKRTRIEYQDLAISNTLTAIHYFSKYNDSTGMRVSFDALAKVYHAQRKYPQAKWFILQSNTLSRALNDKPNIIGSLIDLANLKAEIKDYTLAMRDLDEALKLSVKNHYHQQESQVQLTYAMLYASLDNATKAAIALKRHQAIDDSIKKTEEAVIAARIKTADSLLAAKKKAYMTANKGPYAVNLSKRSDSLRYLSLSLF